MSVESRLRSKSERKAQLRSLSRASPSNQTCTGRSLTPTEVLSYSEAPKEAIVSTISLSMNSH